MRPSFDLLAPHYEKLWSELVPTTAHVPALESICRRLIEHKATYETVSNRVWGTVEYWWYVAITDQMEGGGGAHTFLGNGQSLDRVTTEVPAGLGPFPNFVEGAVVALRGVSAPTTVARAAFNFEAFNGWGYLSKPIEDPYLAAQSNKYVSGKYVADHVYDENVISQQPGALTILKVLVGMDSTIMGPHDPLPPQKPKPTPTEPDVVQTMKGHVMVDVTQLEQEIDMGLSIAQKVIPFLGFLGIPAPIISLLTSAVNGAREIEAKMGVPTSTAVVQATAHVTPGAPNSPVLSQ